MRHPELTGMDNGHAETSEGRVPALLENEVA